MEKERNAAVPLLRTLQSESESESMIGGSEVCSHRKSRKVGYEQKDSRCAPRSILLLVKYVPVNYAFQFSGPVTALRAGTRANSKSSHGSVTLN